MPKQQRSLADRRLAKLSEIKSAWREMYPRLKTKSGKDMGEAPALTLFRGFEDRLIKLSATESDSRDGGLHSVREDWYTEFSGFIKSRNAQDSNHSIHPGQWRRVKDGLEQLRQLL